MTCTGCRLQMSLVQHLTSNPCQRIVMLSRMPIHTELMRILIHNDHSLIFLTFSRKGSLLLQEQEWKANLRSYDSKSGYKDDERGSKDGRCLQPRRGGGWQWENGWLVFHTWRQFAVQHTPVYSNCFDLQHTHNVFYQFRHRLTLQLKIEILLRFFRYRSRQRSLAKWMWKRKW